MADEEEQQPLGRFDRPTQEALETVKKLLRLAEKNDNPAQAAAAASKAQTIMFKMGIDKSALNEEQDVATVVEGKLKSRGGERYTWQQDLLTGICETNFCAVFKYSDAGAHHGTEAVLLGQPQDVEVVRYLFEYLFGQVQSLGLKDFRHAQSTGETEYKWSAPYMRDWAPAAVLGVVEKLHEQRRADEREVTENSMALVVHKDAMLEDAISLRRHGMTVSQKHRFDEACKAARAYGKQSAAHTKGEATLPTYAVDALKHLYTEASFITQFRYGWQDVIQDRQWERQRKEQEIKEAELEAKYASGEVKRPRQRGGRTTYRYLSNGPGRRYHETSETAAERGYKTGRSIPIRQGITNSSSSDNSPRGLE